MYAIVLLIHFPSVPILQCMCVCIRLFVLPCVLSTSAPEEARREAAGRAEAEMERCTPRCPGDPPAPGPVPSALATTDRNRLPEPRSYRHDRTNSFKVKYAHVFPLKFANCVL